MASSPGRIAMQPLGGGIVVSSQRPPQSPQHVRPQPPRREPGSRATIPLRDLQLGDHDTAYYVPRMGDWLLLGILVVIFLGNGVYIWLKMGANSHGGRAIFFGLLLLCVLWAAIVYTFKLSVCVRVGPQGMSVVRGPWRTELAWRDVARLTERTQLRDGQRFRWLVALARDGRRMQIRDDMVLDYQRFRVEVYERFRLWNDHGGTWGTTGGGPYSATELLSGQTTWWTVGAAALGLPGIYFWTLLPETNPLGFVLTAGAIVCGAMSLRSVLARQSYVVDGKAITVSRPFRTICLPWREVARVERTRTAFGGAIQAGIVAGQLALKLAARTDGRVESFDWSPRIPEYLILRGAGHLARIRLHRLERPDEMLAWVEFYDNVSRHAAERSPRRTGVPAQSLAMLPEPQPAAEAPADLSAAAGPLDPWGAGRDGATHSPSVDDTAGRPLAGPAAAPPDPTFSTMPTVITTPGDSWLRAEPMLTGERYAPSFAAPVGAIDGTSAPAAGAEHHDGVPAAPDGIQHAWQRPAAPLASRPFEPFSPPERPEQPEQAEQAEQAEHPEHSEWQARVPSHEPPRAPAAWPPHQPAWPPSGDATLPYEHAQTRPPEQAWFGQPGGALPVQPAPPVRKPAPSQPAAAETFGDLYGDWVPDEVEPGAAEDAPTDSVESLADSFAAWRDDGHWQPPQLPRFGPERGSGHSDGSS